MKIGGRIPWNVTAICEIFETDCLMGKHRPKGVLVNHFKGPMIPFGSLVENRPISTKDQSRIHQFGKKVLPGIFLGYVLHVGRIWKGDILVVDLEELEEMDASEIHAKRLNAKEVMLPKSGENYKFPVADGTVKPCGGHQALKTSTFDTESTSSRRKSPRHSWRFRRVLTNHAFSRLISGCR